MDRESLLRFLGSISFRVIGAGSLVVFNFLVARQLGAEDSGRFFWVFSGMVILTQICLLGLPDVVLKEVAKLCSSDNKGEARLAVRKSLFIVFIASIATSVLLCTALALCAATVDEIHEMDAVAPLVYCLLPASVLLSCSHIVSYSLQGAGSPLRAIFVLSIGQYATFLLLFLFQEHPSAVACAISFSGACFVNLILGLSWIHKTLPPGPGQTNSGFYPWAMARHMWTIAIMSVSVNWGGQFLAGLTVPPEELSYFAVALRVATVISFALTAISFVYAPKVAALYAAGKHRELQQFTTSTVRVLYLLGLPAAVVVFIYSEEVMAIFGESFRRGSALLLILSIGQIINLLTGPVGHLLTMTGHERDMRNMYLASGFLSLALTLILVRHLGVVGAAIATAIALSIQNFGAAILVRRRTGISILPFAKPAQGL